MTFETVLATVEPKSTLASTLEAASRMAKIFKAKLRVIHVLDSVSPIVKAVLGSGRIERAENKARETLEASIAGVAQAMQLGEVPKLEILRGNPGDVLVGLTRPQDMVVIGVHGGGFTSYGSTARQVVRGAQGPLLCVQERPARTHGLKKVLVAVDASQASRKALAVAHEIAKLEGAQLEAVHVFEAPARGIMDLLEDEAATAQVAEKLKAEAAAKLGDVLGAVSPAPALKLLDGFHPARRIAPFAQLGRHDLIVMGSRYDPARKDMVLGSVADELISLATQDVLVIKVAAAKG